jgi:hypothetical protein
MRLHILPITLCLLSFLATPAPAQQQQKDAEPTERLLVRADTTRGREALVARLAAHPTRTLRELDLAVAQLPETKRTAVEAGLIQAIADACQMTDPSPFMARGGTNAIPPYTVGVTRGLLQRAKAGKLPRRSEGDQGHAPVDEFLVQVVREGPPEARVAACEALSLFKPVTRPAGEALVGAAKDADSRVAAAAKSALDVLTNRPGLSAAALARWASALGGSEPEGEASWTIEELRLMDAGSVRERAARRARLEAALREQFDSTLVALGQALAASDALPAPSPETTPRETEEGALPPPASAGLPSSLLQLITSAVANTIARVEDPRQLLTTEAGHPVLAAGQARGVGQRCGAYELRRIVAQRRKADGETEPPPLPEIPYAEECLAALAALAERTEVLVQVEVFRALPAVLVELDPEWFGRLHAALSSPRGELQRAAWESLKLITGEVLPLSAPAWKEWFAQRGR